MGEITLPRWIITNKFMPAGRRTAKKPTYNWEQNYRQSAPVYPASKDFSPFDIKGVFEGWEYRFWAVSMLESSAIRAPTVIAECRACGGVGGQDVISRRMHSDRGGCCKKLCAAFKLLLRDKICVICNMKTGNQKWGVPLCSSGCQQAWCEVETQPKALLAALALIGDI